MHTDITIADAIIAVSETSAEALLGEGWEGSGDYYDLGAYPGDAEALRDELGREPTQDERRRLEAAIRERLDAAAEAEAAS
jgi:hypothetical protein